MSENHSQPDQGTGATAHRYEFYISTIAVIGVIALAVYLGNRFQVLEDQLRYMPPANQQSAAGDTGIIDFAEGRTVYVPVYSHIYSGGGQPHLLEVTLSVRNTDPERTIRLVAVQYFDTRGALVKNHLEEKLELGPMETVDFLVEKQDTRGGSGANFIVTWDSDQPVYEPIIEAVMIGLTKEHSISFITPARPLAARAE
jgi:hypothetical protein